MTEWDWELCDAIKEEIRGHERQLDQLNEVIVWTSEDEEEVEFLEDIIHDGVECLQDRRLMQEIACEECDPFDECIDHFSHDMTDIEEKYVIDWMNLKSL